MEFGGHKTLDYLNLGFTIPVNYHCFSLYTSKYSKALHDFLQLSVNYTQIKKSPELKKRMLKNLNGILYLNNHLYNSDRNENDYKLCGSSFIKAWIGTKSTRGDNQQIMIINNKQIIKILRKKYFAEDGQYDYEMDVD